MLWLNDESIVISAFPFYNRIETKNRIDIIASHYPPKGILDNGFGSEEIRDFVFQIEPMYHIFGHNHSNSGIQKHKNSQYINASIYHKLCQKENQ